MSDGGGLLGDEAELAIESLCGNVGIAKTFDAGVQRAGGFSALRPIAASAAPLRTSAAVSAGASAAVAPAAEIVLLSEAECGPLRKFYVEEMRPFLRQSKSRGSRLADETRASSVFANLRTLVPAEARHTLPVLEDICSEAP